jgi:hypothetical protein
MNALLQEIIGELGQHPEALSLGLPSTRFYELLRDDMKKYRELIKECNAATSFLKYYRSEFEAIYNEYGDNISIYCYELFN